MTRTTTVTANTTAASAFWQITEGSEHCSITGNNLNCVTDGPGNYGSNEDCTFEALQDMVVFTIEFEVEGPYTESNCAIAGGKVSTTAWRCGVQPWLRRN